MSPLRVLVTGATGRIGNAIYVQLKKQPERHVPQDRAEDNWTYN